MKKPVLKVSEDYFEFHFENGFVYDIPRKELKSERLWNEKIAFLAQKNWWSPELEAEFVKLYNPNEKAI